MPTSARLFVCMLVPALLGLGCGRRTAADYVPPQTRAKEALEKALDAWKGGQPKPGALKLGGVGVEVVDSLWTSGQKLIAYQIVSEEDGEGGRFFNVKLTLAKGERAVKYAVLGIDPLWVYAEPDYKKLGGG